MLATLEDLARPTENRSPNLRAIVDYIRPAVAELMETDLAKDQEALVHHAVRANIRTSVNRLRHGSRILEELIADNGLVVVGAEYSLETGRVDFFEGLPESG